MSWKGYTVTGRDALGAVADLQTIMNKRQAMQAAVDMRVAGLRVSVWPALPRDVHLDGVKLMKAILGSDSYNG